MLPPRRLKEFVALWSTIEAGSFASAERGPVVPMRASVAGNAWRNSPELEILKELPPDAARRPFLVFVVPDGGKVSPLTRLESMPRNFDIAVRFYREPSQNEALLEEAEFVMTGGLSKFHSAGLFIEACKLSSAYEGYLFLDGDLEFDIRELSGFLNFAHAAGLDLAQPSLTRDSYTYWKLAYHQPAFLFRQTTFVEVMAPYLSRRALSKTLATFTKSISTYGLDLVWPSLIGSDAIGIVDAFQMRHRERVDHTSGKFYQYLRSIGVDLDEEERRLLEEYGVVPEQPHSRRGYFLRGNRLFAGPRMTIGSVDLQAPEKRADRQIYIDLLMLCGRMRTPRREETFEDRLLPLMNGSRIAGSAT